MEPLMYAANIVPMSTTKIPATFNRNTTVKMQNVILMTFATALDQNTPSTLLQKVSASAGSSHQFWQYTALHP